MKVVIEGESNHEFSVDRYFEGISFKLIKPTFVFGHLFEMIYSKLSKYFPSLTMSLERVNTSFPTGLDVFSTKYRYLSRVPRMSTLAIGAMINYAVSQMPENQMFVNIGIWNGFTFLSGMINNTNKKCTAIDNFSQFGGPRIAFKKRFDTIRSSNHHFFDMDFRDYFTSQHKGQIGVYIYDGPHAYNQQMEGLLLAEPNLASGCILFVDDINWKDPHRATLDFLESRKGDYEIIFEAKTSGNCHPTYWNGVMILRKVR